MASCQTKRKLGSANLSKFNFNEQHRGKKKRTELSVCVWNVKPRTSLRQGDKETIAARRREQIGISWRDVSPFGSSRPDSNSVLADVLTVPKKIIDLENIAEVLSYEVWETHLSDTEKEFLSQFLPKGTDVDQAVWSLLIGENLHFGNSFNKWSSSLCSGNLHPDAVIHSNQHLKASKKVYYADLKKYHDGMKDYLVKWKDLWESCKDPKSLNEMWRKGIRNPDNVRSPITSGRVKPIRISKKEKANKLQGRHVNGAKYMSVVKISRRQHQLVKNIKHSTNGIQSKSLNRVIGDIKGFNVQPYKTFEEEVKKKTNEHWLQLATKDIPVSYECLRKEKSLRRDWVKTLEQELAERRNTMVEEKDDEKDDSEFLMHEQFDHPDSDVKVVCSTAEHIDNGEPQYQSDVDLQGQGDECSVSHSDYDNLNRVSFDHAPESHVNVECSTSEHIDNGEPQCLPDIDLQGQGDEHSVSHSDYDNLNKSLDSNSGVSSIVLDRGFQDALEPGNLLGHENFAEDATVSRISPFTIYHNSQEIHLNSFEEFSSTVPSQGENHGISKPAAFQFLANSDHTMNMAQPRGHLSYAKGIWPRNRVQDSYCETSSGSHLNTLVGDLSLGQPQGINKYPTHMEGSMSVLLNDGAAKSVRSAFVVHNEASFSNPSANQGHNVIIGAPVREGREGQHLFSHPYVQTRDLNNPCLPLLVSNDGLLQTFPAHFREQRQNIESEFNKNQGIKESCYTSTAYISQGHPVNVNMPDRVAFPSHIKEFNKNQGIKESSYTRNASLSQGHPVSVNTQDRVGLNLFPTEHNVWSGVEPSGTATQFTGEDGSLFSVLSSYKHMPSGSLYNPSSTEKLMPLGNSMVGDLPSKDGNCGFYSQQPNSLSSNEATSRTSTMKMGNMPWMNFPYQNPSMRNPMGKPFTSSWN